MATTVQHNIPSGRSRAMVIPREHGAWGILLVPLLTGAAIGIRSVPSAIAVFLFAVTALSLFWLRTPVESFIGAGPLRVQTDSEFDVVFRAIVVLATIATICLTAIFLTGNRLELLRLGVVAAGAFIAQAGLKKLGRRFYMAAQIIGSIGLTATAPGAYYVATGRLDRNAITLWLANWIFACNQVHFVQTRIHSSRLTEGRDKLRHGALFLLGQFAMSAALLAAWRMGLVPVIALVAFVPILVRGFWWFTPGARPLAVKRLGWTELAHAVTFGMLLVAAYVL